MLTQSCGIGIAVKDNALDMTQWLAVGLLVRLRTGALGAEGRLNGEDGKKCCEVKWTSRTMSCRKELAVTKAGIGRSVGRICDF